jgi:hypothetical protein
MNYDYYVFIKQLEQDKINLLSYIKQLNN